MKHPQSETLNTRTDASLRRRVARLARNPRAIPARLLLKAVRMSAVRRALRRVYGFFDPSDPAFLTDPYPFYRKLRERDPVSWSPFGSWFVTRYADATIVLSDPRFIHPDYRTEREHRAAPGLISLLHSNALISLNPPDHTRLRRLVGDAFSQQTAELKTRIQSTTDRLLDGLNGARRMDFISEFALPLPVTVVSDMFGIPFAEGMKCQVEMRHLTAAIEVAPEPARLKRAESAAHFLIDYFKKRLGERQAHPGPDLLSALIRAQEKDPAFSDDELIASAILLFGAGHETSVAFLGTALHTLLSDRHLWEELLENPRLIPAAVDELLRYESPAQFFGRQAQEDMVIGGKQIRRGQTLMVMAGAVNRDPERFPDPDRVDFTRRDNSHFAFGHGIHTCLGQGLARTEGQIVLETLLRRLPTLHADTPAAEWRSNLMFRALDSFHVRW